jgi:hypothetical protein
LKRRDKQLKKQLEDQPKNNTLVMKKLKDLNKNLLKNWLVKKKHESKRRNMKRKNALKRNGLKKKNVNVN